MLEAASSTQQARGSPDQLHKTYKGRPCLWLGPIPDDGPDMWRPAVPAVGGAAHQDKRTVLSSLRFSLAGDGKRGASQPGATTLGTPNEANLPLLAS